MTAAARPLPPPLPRPLLPSPGRLFPRPLLPSPGWIHHSSLSLSALPTSSTGSAAAAAQSSAHLFLLRVSSARVSHATQPPTRAEAPSSLLRQACRGDEGGPRRGGPRCMTAAQRGGGLPLTAASAAPVSPPPPMAPDPLTAAHFCVQADPRYDFLFLKHYLDDKRLDFKLMLVSSINHCLLLHCHPENVNGVETQVPINDAYMGSSNSFTTFTGLSTVPSEIDDISIQNLLQGSNLAPATK
ncbi:hypothetical protein U9M48_033322 [Paspalum notatum var. saurae]|uniref:Uncharacterized protein n=1 Tax=Paspalum notatum var. saurae TaxID=547442 RepID=A0AAQ3X5E8_PASNO